MKALVLRETFFLSACSKILLSVSHGTFISLFIIFLRYKPFFPGSLILDVIKTSQNGDNISTISVWCSANEKNTANVQSITARYNKSRWAAPRSPSPITMPHYTERRSGCFSCSVMPFAPFMIEFFIILRAGKKKTTRCPPHFTMARSIIISKGVQTVWSHTPFSAPIAGKTYAVPVFQNPCITSIDRDLWGTSLECSPITHRVREIIIVDAFMHRSTLGFALWFAIG